MEEEYADITPEASDEMISQGDLDEATHDEVAHEELAPELVETSEPVDRPADEVALAEEEPLEIPPAFEEPPAAPAAEEKPPRRFVQRAFRWTVGLLIVFGLGFALAIFALFLPSMRQLDRAREELRAADQSIVDLNAQIGSLSALEAENEALVGELQDVRLQVHILSALADVRAAQHSLAIDDPVQAKVHLTTTPEILQDLEDLVGTDQAEQVASMQDRLDLALREIDDDLFAAQSDLEVLANNLVQLENIYFATP